MLIFVFGILIVVVTAFTAHYEGSMPYFPIEISRMGAGPKSWRVFVVSITLFNTNLISTVTRIYESTSSLVIFIVPFGLQILAIIDDVTSWSMHMVGVLIFVGSIIVHVIFYEIKYLPIICVGLAIYFLRLILKFIVVCYYELGDDIHPLLWMKECFKFGNNDFRKSTFDRVKTIMYKGTWKNKTVTPFVFKLCGVMQWIAIACFLVPLNIT